MISSNQLNKNSLALHTPSGTPTENQKNNSILKKISIILQKFFTQVREGIAFLANQCIDLFQFTAKSWNHLFYGKANRILNLNPPASPQTPTTLKGEEPPTDATTTNNTDLPTPEEIPSLKADQSIAQQVTGPANKVFNSTQDDNENLEEIDSNKINPSISSEKFPLHLAIKRGDQKITDELLNKGAGLFIEDDQGLTPFDHAILQKNQPILKILLKSEGILDADNLPPLEELSTDPGSIHLDQVKHLRGAIFNSETCRDLPLINAIIKDDLELLKTNFGTLTSTEEHLKALGTSLLHIAAAFCKSENIIMHLLSKGLSPEQRDINNRTPLHIAAENKNQKIFLILLKKVGVENAFNSRDCNNHNSFSIFGGNTSKKDRLNIPAAQKVIAHLMFLIAPFTMATNLPIRILRELAPSMLLQTTFGNLETRIPAIIAGSLLSKVPVIGTVFRAYGLWRLGKSSLKHFRAVRENISCRPKASLATLARLIINMGYLTHDFAKTISSDYDLIQRMYTGGINSEAIANGFYSALNVNKSQKEILTELSDKDRILHPTLNPEKLLDASLIICPTCRLSPINKIIYKSKCTKLIAKFKFDGTQTSKNVIQTLKTALKTLQRHLGQEPPESNPFTPYTVCNP